MEDNNEQPKLSKEQEKARNEQMTRAVAFEEIINTKGFEYIKAYYMNQMQNFVTDIFNAEQKPLSDFEGQRREIIGLKKLITRIDGDVKYLQDERAKESK